MLAGDLMQALQAQPATSSQLAAKFGVTDRHVRRTIADLVLEKKVTRTRDGRDFLYSLAAAVVEEEAATTTITGPAGTSDICGHNVRDRDLGHSSDTGETISDICGHDCGHAKHQSSKQRHRNRERDGKRGGQAQIPQQYGPGPDPCQDRETPLCPLSYAEFERDRIQFVLLDRKFRDLLLQRAGTDNWETRHVRGLVWIYPRGDLSLQVGKDTITFYSNEPGDMSGIARWVHDTFNGEYADIGSLTARIKNPADLCGEELTVVIKHPDTVSAIRSHVQLMADHGVYMLPCPNENTPGLKIYEPKAGGTMRVEFIIHNQAQGLAGLNMRAALMNNMPRIHQSHGLFWEFIQKYYSHMHHPLMIDTGGHDFLQALDRVTGQFTSAIETIAARLPVPTRQATLEEDRFREIEAAIEKFQAGIELEDIVREFQRTLKLEETATKVFLAAWSVWMKRNFRGRVLKEDVTSLLLRANDPLSVDQIADAIVKLKAVRLLETDSRLEIRFSPGGTALARKLTAKREGVQ